MPKMNFSTEEMQVYDLTLDLMRNDFAAHVDGEKVSKKQLEDHLRNKINNDILGGLSMYQAIRRNNLVMYEIMEQVVEVAIGEEVMDSPFIREFVQFRNRALGDNTEFYYEGGLLSVASFAGNHWDTNRQSIDLGESFTLPSEWIYIHVYDELERFLLGIVSIEKLMDKIYKSINKYIQDRLYVQFQNIAQAVPTDFVASGNSEEAVGTLCDKVQAAGGYTSLTIAGTKAALRKLAGVVPDKLFADSQREAKAHTGSIGEWEGNKLMVIPQTMKSGTFELALNDNQVFILGGDVQPILLEYIGDTRAQMVTDGRVNNDMTYDFQIQTKMAMGMLLPPYFGVFTFMN